MIFWVTWVAYFGYRWCLWVWMGYYGSWVVGYVVLGMCYESLLGVYGVWVGILGWFGWLYGFWLLCMLVLVDLYVGFG